MPPSPPESMVPPDEADKSRRIAYLAANLVHREALRSAHHHTGFFNYSKFVHHSSVLHVDICTHDAIRRTELQRVGLDPEAIGPVGFPWRPRLGS